ncbi:GNAT family N-acetyltransferase [Alkalihalobacillus sp. LMS39]|uniref:GNAT family N-acetyltransferase n=1 Tax=Alkalihalobacillus sp. LMS39 TaxID=2924032 RepID=UPI001FB50BC3|nr:GNAT family N-acetyltransferase [Alkalihalobacillus sp. LMS39]UOE95802.1 GNAT family N-acetyltransferase [Alkalihalobacillus sp. LMS39]
MEKSIVIEPMKREDWNAVKEIYNEGIATGNATFQTEAPSWEEWDDSHLSECRNIAKLGDEVVGWAALSPVSSRCVYAGVAEVSVYVSQTNAGKGIGSQLLDCLIKQSEENGYWTLQAGIFPENLGSLHLHKKLGFREIGRREKVGKMAGIWRDVLLLERRSQNVGVN